MPEPLILELDDQAVVAARGADAHSFLQGQLSADLLGLARRPGRLAAACNAQGRVTEILRVAQLGEELLLVLPAALAAEFITRLARHRLRARIEFRDCRDSLRAIGVLDSGPGLPLPGERLALPCGPGRSLRIVDAATTEQYRTDGGPWAAAAVAAGEPSLAPDTRAKWLPQMLNLDLLDAISFSKGCYVGQEIVARTQHLGRLKRRMLLYHLDGPPVAAGAALQAGADQVAEVVASAPAQDGSLLLAVTELSRHGQALQLAASGAECRPLDLPYDVPGAAAREAG